MSELEHQISSELEALRSDAERLGPEMVSYYSYSRNRFAVLARFVEGALTRLPNGPASRILDVGPSFQTMLFRRLWTGAHIDTIGLPDEKFPAERGGRHFIFDLTLSADPALRPSLGGYDLVVFSEVIEHLHTSPVPALRFLASALRPGGLMIVTTPNGVGLQHRLRMVVGRNPREMLREDLSNPGHFREYTLLELLAMASEAGLKACRVEAGHYTTTGSIASRLLGAITPLLPRGLRKDMMVLFERR